MKSLFALLAVLMGAASLTAQPNVLLIISDDLNNRLGCYGDTVVKTPNIDRLAARGVRFDRAYCQYPVCNPSRSSFLSGLRPDTTGVMRNKTSTRDNMPDAVMLPQFFREHGYRSFASGKIFHTGVSDAPSWDTDIAEVILTPTKEQRVEKGGKTAEDARKSFEWIKVNLTADQLPDHQVALDVVRLIEESLKGEKPFFAAAGFRRPHLPYIAPSKNFDMYPAEAMPLPDEPRKHLADIPPLALMYDPASTPNSHKDQRAAMSAYFACITFMDAQVGVLLDAMDRNKLWDNTIVVFMSDHGYHLGEHGGMWHKGSVMEESSRAPLIVAAPGGQRGVASSRLVEYVDIYPTLVDFCGLKVPDILEGTSFVPLLNVPEREWKRAAFCQVLMPTKPTDVMGRSLRTERWHYIEWAEGQEGTQLYDTTNDLHEYVNLAHDPKHADTVRELSVILKAGWKASQPTQP
ncbi:MAG: sulfatase [Verrucomicrobia bacterium]|nr:sulfatase [Verrucomicrobiota bacterium]